MKTYQTVLLGINLYSKQCKALLEKAKQFSSEMGATLKIAYVIPRLYSSHGGMGRGFAFFEEIERELLAEADCKLAELGYRHGISVANRIVLSGNVVTSLAELADQLNVELILVGEKHKRFRRFRRDVVSGLLKYTECPVMALQIPSISESTVSSKVTWSQTTLQPSANNRPDSAVNY